MHGPVRVVRRHLLPGAFINDARVQPFHGDTPLDGTDVDAKVAGHALVILDVEYAVFGHRDRLVRGILAGRIAPSTLDAEVRVNPRFSDVV